jgi:hypothetical protein
MNKTLALTAIFLLLSAPIVFAQGEPCQGNFDFDQDVDANDVTVFLQHFGRNQYDNPCPPSGPAMVPKTGQTYSCCTGDDGALKKGVVWPNPRFTDNGDGTVTDNLTGLIWLKNADCFGTRTWLQALSDCNTLNSEECGLTDGSSAGDWRLPNRFELESLLHLGFFDPAVPNTVGTGKWTTGDPFINVQSLYYWSSTTWVGNTNNAWSVHMRDGYVNYPDKSSGSGHVWPVRGGQ